MWTNFTYDSSASTTAGTRRVRVQQIDAECQPVAPDTTPPPTYQTTANSDGTLVRATYPYGTYRVCVEGRWSGAQRYYVPPTNSFANTAYAGLGTTAAVAGLTKPLTATNTLLGSCPF
jgi:hypothetical protein